ATDLHREVMPASKTLWRWETRRKRQPCTRRETMTETKKISKREFFKKAGLATAGAVGATALATPYVKAQAPIKWRLQTYAGPALAEHVVKNAVDWFNVAANGEMEIELYTADQLVP